MRDSSCRKLGIENGEQKSFIHRKKQQNNLPQSTSAFSSK